MYCFRLLCARSVPRGGGVEQGGDVSDLTETQTAHPGVAHTQDHAHRGSKAQTTGNIMGTQIPNSIISRLNAI